MAQILADIKYFHKYLTFHSCIPRTTVPRTSGPVPESRHERERVEFTVRRSTLYVPYPPSLYPYKFCR